MLLMLGNDNKLKLALVFFKQRLLIKHFQNVG